MPTTIRGAMPVAQTISDFDGDWWLLIEEQDLDHSGDQRWTLRGGRVIRHGADVGTCQIEDDQLVVTAAEGEHHSQMRFSLLARAAGFSVDLLSGFIEDQEGPVYCAMLRNVGLGTDG